MLKCIQQDDVQIIIRTAINKFELKTVKVVMIIMMNMLIIGTCIEGTSGMQKIGRVHCTHCGDNVVQEQLLAFVQRLKRKCKSSANVFKSSYPFNNSIKRYICLSYK